MCFFGYLASDGPLLTIPQTDPPTFSVSILDSSVVAKLGLPFPSGWMVAEIGAHTGCACGFHSDPAWPWLVAKKIDEEDSDSRGRLAGYVRKLNPARVQLFSFWNQDPAPQPRGQLSAPSVWISNHWDPLPDGWVVEVSEQALSPIHPWEDGPIPEKTIYP